MGGWGDNLNWMIPNFGILFLERPIKRQTYTSSGTRLTIIIIPIGFWVAKDTVEQLMVHFRCV